MSPRKRATALAQDYIDGALAAPFPLPEAIATAPRDADHALLLFCPKQGGWHTGQWFGGRWLPAVPSTEVLEPTHWMAMPPEPEQ